MPPVLGLCPTHSDVFYMPHGGKCPEPGCQHVLVEYVPRDTVSINELRSRIWALVGRRHPSGDFDGATQ